MQNLSSENYNTLLKKIKDLSKWKIFYVHRLEDFIPLLGCTPQIDLQIQCNTIKILVALCFSPEKKLTLNFTWKYNLKPEYTKNSYI